jgi:hypothetical protein
VSLRQHRGQSSCAQSRTEKRGNPIGKLLKCAGLKVDRLGGLSLRLGQVTRAGRNGAKERRIMEQTGHKTVATLRRQTRKGKTFSGKCGAGPRDLSALKVGKESVPGPLA